MSADNFRGEERKIGRGNRWSIDGLIPGQTGRLTVSRKETFDFDLTKHSSVKESS
jgi:hypothetical protein